MIDKTAIIDPSAIIGEGVSIGPWTCIGPDVEIGAGTEIASHVVIKGPTKIGRNNQIYQYSSIGEVPQDMKFSGEKSYLIIGDNNIIREFCTIHRGTKVGGGKTIIGHNNLFMNYVHVAHDCIIGDNNTFANNAALSGHVTIKNYVGLAGFAAVHQFVVVGEHSYVAHTAMVVQDVLPYLLVCGDPAKPKGLNSVGLKRRGFNTDQILAIKRAYKIIFRRGLTVAQALEQLEIIAQEYPVVDLMIEGLRNSERGIARERDVADELAEIL
jgi:UDP-N-acetylglucosamine acyltransferase